MRSYIRKLKKKLRGIRKQEWRNYTFLVLAIGVFLVAAGIIWVSTFKIPTLDSFAERRVVESTKIYDKTGEVLLYDVNQEIKRTVIPFENISRNIKNATIAIEDREFYEHIGVKPTSFMRAVLANLLSLSFSQGGSTITQQVVKNSLLSNEKLISRKIKEWVLAIKLENILTKDEILNLYLNEIPYGGALYGIEEASQTFFGKPASDLSIPESAYLAALPQAPSYYSPYGKNREDLDSRKNLVLHEMLENGFITETEYEEAKVVLVEFKPRPEQGIKAPHFVFSVMEELASRYGENALESGGLRVITTLDYTLQEKAEEIAEAYAKENAVNFNAENMAFVAIDPKTGGILAMVGSRNYFDEEIEGNFNIATAHRQPGSTFKPFVYAAAFNEGYTPETILFDVKTQFSTSCSVENTTSLNGCYSPENYDNVFRGPISIRNALAQSVNIPAVKTLYLVGIRDAIEVAEQMGIESLTNSDQYGLTLVLGGGEVALLDMTSAYGVFAHEGVRNPQVSIIEVRDRAGKILEEFEERREEVLPRETALKISSILSDNIARAPAFGQTSHLHFPNQDVAVKTGTTNDYKDAWILGYTPSVVLGAWAGNNDNTPMEKRVAGFIVAPAWRALMDVILEDLPNEQFPEPVVEDSFELKPVLRGQWAGGNSHLIDTISGKLATEYTPRETIEEKLSGGIHSILYWLDKNNPRGPVPENPSEDSQFSYWEYGVARWLNASGIFQPRDPSVPTEYDDVHTEDDRPTFSITRPRPNQNFDSDESISVSLSYKTNSEAREARFFVNGNLIGSSDRKPFSFSFEPQDLPFLSSRNTLKVILFDKNLNSAEEEVVFEVNEDPS
jgi:1A family penicillin-binding protein